MVTRPGAVKGTSPDSRVQSTEKKIKDDAAEKRRVFMTFLTRALRTKSCPHYVQTSRKIYRHMIPIGRTHPDQLAEVSVQIDKLPRGKSAEWYRINAMAIFRDAELAVKERTIPHGAGTAIIGRGAERYPDEEWEQRRGKPASTMAPVVQKILKDITDSRKGAIQVRVERLD